MAIEVSTRASGAQVELPAKTPSFVLGADHKSYRHQFANLYFARLTFLKEVVENKAREKWGGGKGSPPLVPRVLDVEKSQVCFIVGTVYLDMPMKPNVLEDVGRDRYLPDPPPREKYLSDEDTVMLEDESGRVQLVGDALQRSSDDEDGRRWGNNLVTGVIMAALGHETASGAFEVRDVCFAGMAPMMFKELDSAAAMDIDEEVLKDEWVAFISGLQIDEISSSDIKLQLLSEFLLGEGGSAADSAVSVQRLVVVGNSLATVSTTDAKLAPETNSKAKRFGQEASNYSPIPINNLSDLLYEIASAMPVHLLAGATDPTGTLLPQQALPRAMFGDAKNLANFQSETNPTWLALEGQQSSSLNARRSLLVHSGQAVDDMFKYVPSPPVSRLDLACNSIMWRHMAPTAPDTLWCYPFLTVDPFVLKHSPDIYAVGCQPEFATRLVRGAETDSNGDAREERQCRVVLVPSFNDEGELVLVNLKNLDVRSVKFGTRGFKGEA